MFFSSHLSSSYLTYHRTTFFWIRNFWISPHSAATMLPPSDLWLLSGFMWAFLLFFQVDLAGRPHTIFTAVNYVVQSELIYSVFTLPRFRVTTQYRQEHPLSYEIYFCLGDPIWEILNELCFIRRCLRFLLNSSHGFEFGVCWRAGLFLRGWLLWSLWFWRWCLWFRLCHNKTDL